MSRLKPWLITTQQFNTCSTSKPYQLAVNLFAHTETLPTKIGGVFVLKYKVKLLPRPCMPLADGGSTEKVTPLPSFDPGFINNPSDSYTEPLTCGRLYCIPKAV